MDTFRFIHAADLHLGSPFQGLALKDEAIAARFARPHAGKLRGKLR